MVKGKYAVSLQFMVRDESLTKEQEAHIEKIGADFCGEMTTKYIAGQKEHGGNLFDMSIDALLNNAIEEVVDQYVYLTTLRTKLRANNENKR